jgi:hypothetical protein
MADNEKPVEKPAEPFNDRRRNLVMVALVGGLMLLEGVGIFIGVRYLTGGAEQAEAVDGVLVDDGEGGMRLLPPQVEVKVTDVVAYNRRSGRVILYQMSIYVEVDAEYMRDIDELIENRINTIDDRLSQIVRASDPKYLEEPDLNTIRRQFKTTLEDIFGEKELINKILLPQFSSNRAE